MRELKIEGFILPISLKVEYALTANGRNVWTFTHVKTVESLGDMLNNGKKR